MSGPGKRAMPSIVSADFRVVGNVNSDGDVQLDGSIEGNLKARSITIGETGTVRGEVRAERIHIQGTVNGPVRARTVEIAKTAKLIGDVFYESLTVETGGIVEGGCKRWDSEKDSVEEANKPTALTPRQIASRG